MLFSKKREMREEIKDKDLIIEQLKDENERLKEVLGFNRSQKQQRKKEINRRYYLKHKDKIKRRNKVKQPSYNEDYEEDYQEEELTEEQNKSPMFNNMLLPDTRGI